MQASILFPVWLPNVNIMATNELPPGTGNGALSAKRAIHATQKLADNIKAGKTQRGVNSQIFQSSGRDLATETKQPKKQKAATVEEVPDEGKYEDTASEKNTEYGTSSESETDDADTTEVSPVKKANRKTHNVNGLLQDLSHIDIDLTNDLELESKKPIREATKFKRPKHEFVTDLSTCRRHMQSEHKATYHLWAKANNFKLMLPDDSERHHQADKAPDTQSSLDGHVKPVKKVLPYSDDEFK
ncbi:hypothetical protein EWM64_g10367 [Hericium alpestre]|uniref:Uncharacterized protein n=1 Tax=Hericium alpestre TaxID=135208 RepID=A0A4Y9ZFY1_9AGAM|nr:hypothetical protein EWM64_g10367 [Hericium alpestre]